ncbi:DUF664 domain-containing protein [Streptomyces sp. ST1020]|uniref:mycothiol transferase n=1 Tax=Streptomyces sp. ST1020 TaxID=1848901 RepID=UPI0034C5DCFB
MWTTVDVPDAGLPSLLLCDGPHGVRKQTGGATAVYDSAPATCFPPAVALASSWDPELLRRVGEALGREARALGVEVLLGPGVNIKRSPLCGRNFEYFSEDPLLSGVLGAAHVTGVQSRGVGASVKHFAANNQETDRMRVSADVDERPLREIYLPAFERIVKEARPATVMAAYNKVNGVPAPTGTNLLGLVKHCAGIELGYFGDTFGRPYFTEDPPPWWYTRDAELNADMWATAEESRADIVGLYRAAWAHTAATVAELPLDAVGLVPWWPKERRATTLHHLLTRVCADTSRHAGHADIVRELLDGSVGDRADKSNVPEEEASWWEEYREKLERSAREADEG